MNDNEKAATPLRGDGLEDTFYLCDCVKVLLHDTAKSPGLYAELGWDNNSNNNIDKLPCS